MALLRKLLMVLLALNLAVSTIDLIDEFHNHSEQIGALRKMTSDVQALDEKLAALEKRHGERLNAQRLELRRLRGEAQGLIERFHHVEFRWRKKAILVVLSLLAFLFCLDNKQFFAERAPVLPQTAA